MVYSLLWLLSIQIINQSYLTSLHPLHFISVYSSVGQHQLLRSNRLCNILILLTSLKGLELVFGHNWTKIVLEMFFIKCTDIWPNLILILPRIRKKKPKVWHPLYSNACNDVTDFKICGFHRNIQKNLILHTSMVSSSGRGWGGCVQRHKLYTLAY